MNKYYTPKIEEFHVGFEYEEKSSGLWTKQVYNELSPILNKKLEDDYGVLYDTIQDYINQEIIRVKYLDQEDIERELKISPKRGGSYIFEKDSCFRPNWINGVHVMKTRIYFHPINTWTKIEYYIENEWEKFFEGSIKNISEFRILLKQVGYE